VQAASVIASRDSAFRDLYAKTTDVWVCGVCVCALIALALWFVDVQFSIAWQMAALAVGVALFGVPHGGLDHIVGRRTFGFLQRPTALVASSIFLLAYGALAGLVLVAWWWAPRTMLVIFLLGSAIHFALRDETLEPASSGARSPIGLLHSGLLGAAPIVVPWLAFPEQVATVFGWLSLTPADDWLPRWHPFVSWAAIGTLLVLLILTAAHETDRALRTRRCREALATIGVFAVVPPLLAFAWYFCFLHSARHALTLAHRLHEGVPAAAIRWFAWQTLPLSLATLVIAFGAYQLFARAPMGNESETLARVVFWGLAALTFPHMLLTAVWEHRQRQPFSSGKHRQH
jgi:beta-carotene 15,15'-dioxygenase